MPNAAQRRGLDCKYLRLDDLRRLEHLLFTGRRAIEGQYSGQHATPQRGHSVEFRDYRQYIPGDAITNVDWKVYGRSDKLFIKIFEHQAELTAHLLVDASASMGYRGLPQSMLPWRQRRGPGGAGGDTSKVGVRKSEFRVPSSDFRVRSGDRSSKYDYACSLAAAIGFLILKQNDRVGFAAAQDGVIEHVRAGGTMPHLAGILDAMERIEPRGSAHLADAIHQLAPQARRRDVLILLSDLLDDSDELIAALSLWLHRGGEVILFQILHQDELKLPSISAGVFVDSETSQRIRLTVEDVRAEYESRLRRFLDAWSKTCSGLGIDYTLVSTAEPYVQALLRYLTARAARR